MADQEKGTERQLIVRNQATPLSSLGENPYLAIAGFSPLLSERLMRLNEVLPARRVRSVGIELQPGQTPILNAHVDFDSTRGYKAMVNGFPGEKRAEIALSGSGKMVSIDDLKMFATTYLPDQEARLLAPSSARLLEPIPDFDKDLKEVSEDELRTWFEQRPANETSGFRSGGVNVDYLYGSPRAEVILLGQKLPLFLLKFMQVHYDLTTVGCELANSQFDTSSAFYYTGAPDQVEKVIEGMADLLDKPMVYPFKLPQRG